MLDSGICDDLNNTIKITTKANEKDIQIESPNAHLPNNEEHETMDKGLKDEESWHLRS